MTRRRLTIQEAATELDASVDALRARIRRGSLDSEKGDDGRVYVWLDPPSQEPGDRRGKDESKAGVEAPELIEVLQDQVGYLREQLAEEREARRRADTIIAQLSQANANLSARIPELEAPKDPANGGQSEGQGSQRAGPEGSSTPESTEGDIEPPRRWWGRLFGRG